MFVDSFLKASIGFGYTSAIVTFNLDVEVLLVRHRPNTSSNGLSGLIMMNAVIIGLETDFPEKFPWDIVENIFLVFFTMELVTWSRLRSQGYMPPSLSKTGS